MAAAESSENVKTNLTDVRRDWYQTDSKVFVTIFIKNLKQDDVNASYETDRLKVSTLLPSGDCYELDLRLFNEIVPQECLFKVFSTKLEIQLKKRDATTWNTLEKPEEVASVNPTLQYPSSYKKHVDWNVLESQIKKEEETQKAGGEEGLNKLFQDIYAKGSDEVKKAMNKSFFESSGTVLSTNWNDVGTKQQQVKPPDGVEFKKWE